jgi:hypothetical protein
MITKNGGKIKSCVGKNLKIKKNTFQILNFFIFITAWFLPSCDRQVFKTDLNRD